MISDLQKICFKFTIPLSRGENSGYFQFIKVYHRIYHVKIHKNLNVVLPLADIFFGTAVWKMSDSAPRITPETATQMARTNGRHKQIKTA